MRQFEIPRQTVRRRTSVTRIAVVDEATLLPQSLAVVLSREPDFEVIWSAHQPADWYAKLEGSKPELMVIDIDAFHGTWQLVQRVRRSDPQIRIVVLTRNACDAFIKQAFELGVSAYLLKSEPLHVVLQALRDVVERKPVYSSEIARRLHFDGRKHSFPPSRSLTSWLTSAQLEILRLLARGHSAKEIGRQLKLSVKGVNSHTYRIMKKLDIHSRVGLARLAIREGLVAP